MLLAAVAGCAPHDPVGDLTGSYEEAGVAVALLLHDGRLTATFRPEQDGFHLYSATLPRDGLNGLGRPTVLAPGHGLTPTGPAVADRATVLWHEDGLGVDLPVYPDGPVTLSVPATVSGEPVDALIGYAACSARLCLMPVVDRIVTLR
jgi:hypothetical protein